MRAAHARSAPAFRGAALCAIVGRSMDRVTVYAPGSTSNVGPGFDCLGIAVTGLGDKVSAARRAVPGVRVQEVSDPRIPSDPDRNTAALAALAVLERAEAGGVGLELRIDKGLPLAGGLGGSAASAVAGAVAANAVLGGPLDTDALLECAIAAEAEIAGRHADNVAPSLLGGAVLVLGLDPPRYARLTVHPSLRLVFVMPSYQVATAQARALLPVVVERSEAVAQAAHLASLVVALERGDLELLRTAIVDRIAEPGRIPLYPGYAEAREAALAAGAVGVAVSGAGPTLLALCTEDSARAVGEAAAHGYDGLGEPPRVHVARVDAEGARIL
jgi:homoserine kinase